MLMKDVVEGVEYAYQPNKYSTERVLVEQVKVHRLVRGDWRSHKSARKDGVLVGMLHEESGDIKRHLQGVGQGKPVVKSILPRYLAQTWTSHISMMEKAAVLKAKRVKEQAALQVTLNELTRKVNWVVGYEAFEVSNLGRVDTPRFAVRLAHGSTNVDRLMQAILAIVANDKDGV